jgi:hypothetical protein
MKHIKGYFLLVSLTIPMIALASGNNVFYSLYVLIVSFFIFLISIFFIKMELARKAILFFVYIATIAIIIFFIKDIPYTNNIYAINLSLAIIPVITFISTYLILKSRMK